jgi:threonine dehydratase
MENLQVTGSFKARGALYALAAARDSGIERVVTASAGNHGAGVAHAASNLGMTAIVVVPESAPERKVAAIRKDEVSVERVAGGYDQAEARARCLARELGLLFVSPYDDEHVAAGNGSSLGFEIVDALGRVPEQVLAPVGGGGLATGLAWALAHEAGEDPRRRRRVWTVQSESSPAFADSLERGRAVETLEPKGPTLAEGLEGGISRSGFARAASVVAGVFVVGESDIAASMKVLWQVLGARVEGSGAASLVPVLARQKEIGKGGDLAVVLTGRNVDEGVFRRVVDGFCPW